ncbi:MAG: hypothetical protein PGN13_02970 [Patulibacter minatonensis]
MSRSSSFRSSARSALSSGRKRTVAGTSPGAAFEEQVDSLVTELAASAAAAVAATPTTAPVATLSALPSAGSSATAIDLLWSQRQVAHYGTLTRIEVPVDGPLEALPSCRALSVELERRWVARRSLQPHALPTTVVVELIRDFGSQTRLVLLVTADHLPVEQPPLAVAMARDIRAAMRALGGNEHLRTVPAMRVVSDALV